MPTSDRHFRVLGLPPGASMDEVRRAYRDLVQVWHPDRFGGNERLRAKAERNLQRINEAFDALRGGEPAQPARRETLLSQSYQAILDLGDMVKTGMHRQFQLGGRDRHVVLGLDDRAPAPRRVSQRWWIVAGVAGVAVVLAAAAMVFALGK